MRQLTTKEKKLLKLAETGGTDQDLFILDQINELEEKFDRTVEEIKASIPNLDDVLASVKGKKGDKGYTPIKGKDYFDGEDGDDGEDGATPTNEKIISLIKPLIPKPIKGDSGYTPIKGKDYFDGEDADEKKITTDVFKKINNTLTIKSIQGLQSSLEALKKQIDKKVPFYVGASTQKGVQVYDLSSQLDGSTKTFNIPAVSRIVGIQSSSYPNAFRPTTDYTNTQTSITFTNAIDAPSTLASGQTLLILYVEA